jgi:uncharacterized protein YceK
MKYGILLLVMLLSGCATTVAVVDTAGAAAVYSGAAVVKGVWTVGEWAVDAVIPDNDEKKK